MKQSLAEYLLNKLADAVRDYLNKQPIPKDAGVLFFYHQLQATHNEVRTALKEK